MSYPTFAQADVVGLVADLAARQLTNQKGQVNGYSSLNASGLVPPGELASSGTPSSATFLRGDRVWATSPGGSDPFATLAAVLASDLSTGANTTPINVTGLVFTFVANATYAIEIFGIASSAAATTGYGLQLDTSVAISAVALTFFHQLANTGTLSGGSSIADDASVGVSSGVPTLNVNVPIFGAGVLRTGANGGTAQLRFRSEVAAVSTIKAGTVMRVHRVA